MTFIYGACAVILLVAGILAAVRAERGPTMLNRTVALDLFATVLVGGVALEAAWSRRTDVLPVLVALSMVGFVSSVAIARFAATEPRAARRIRSAAEVAAEAARQRAEEEAADAAWQLAAQRAAADAEAADARSVAEVTAHPDIPDDARIASQRRELEEES